MRVVVARTADLGWMWWLQCNLGIFLLVVSTTGDLCDRLSDILFSKIGLKLCAVRVLFGGLAVAGGGDGGGGGSCELCCSVVVMGGLAVAGSGFVVMTVAGRYVKLVYCFVCGGCGRIRVGVLLLVVGLVAA